jgi:hypothetical protein
MPPAAQPNLEPGPVEVDPAQLDALERVVREALGRDRTTALDTLRRSEREEEVGLWLEDRGVEEAWDLSPTLVGAGLDVDWLDDVADRLSERDHAGYVLAWLATEITGDELLREIREASTRISELVSGVVLRPGASFSVNDHVGPRTEEKGFVPGGAILEGEFVEQIGGGVSQFATTMYNAAYFGGYELVRYKAHSYYISRYPMGREATLNYQTVDLEIRNNSPYGLLIEATTTGSSVTVTTWGTEWVEVESVTGEPFNVRQGRVRNGFDVVDTRVLRFPDVRVEREERFTLYLPEN